MPETTTTPADANTHCLGPENEQAGKADSCAGCPNQTLCASGTLTIDPAIAQIRTRLSSVKRRILVLSGKGGVGKSTVSTTLSFALSQDSSVGLLDLDICGPSIPKMTGTEGETVHTSNEGWCPVYLSDNLAVMSIGFMLPSTDEAVIWRGPKKNGIFV
jgi:Mrp family chromosome partitioning ATPase